MLHVYRASLRLLQVYGENDVVVILGARMLQLQTKYCTKL